MYLVGGKITGGGTAWFWERFNSKAAELPVDHNDLFGAKSDPDGRTTSRASYINCSEWLALLISAFSVGFNDKKECAGTCFQLGYSLCSKISTASSGFRRQGIPASQIQRRTCNCGAKLGTEMVPRWTHPRHP